MVLKLQTCNEYAIRVGASISKTAQNLSYSFFHFFLLFIYWWLCWVSLDARNVLSLGLQWAGLTLHQEALASDREASSCCRAQALGAWFTAAAACSLSSWERWYLVVLACGIFWTREWTCLCIGQVDFNHWPPGRSHSHFTGILLSHTPENLPSFFFFLVVYCSVFPLNTFRGIFICLISSICLEQLLK